MTTSLSPTDLGARLTAALGLHAIGIARTLTLLDEGNTVPFIARYRKERTGGLDEVAIRAIEAAADRMRQLETRRASVIASIETQGKLSDELRARLLRAESLTEVEDLYLPFRPKRVTRAMKARERGLGPLAELVAAGDVEDRGLRERAAVFVSVEREVPDIDEALEGACDIVAETIADDGDTRQALRLLMNGASITSTRARLAKDDVTTYRTYESFCEPRSTLKPHQVLALDRGEREGQLSVSVDVDREAVLEVLRTRHRRGTAKGPREVFESALVGAWRRLIQPALEREVRADLTEKAHAQAIREFAQNLGNLLLQRPVDRMRVLAIDPGQRTGCKLAALDEHGRLLEHGTIYPHPPQSDRAKAAVALVTMIKRHALTGVAIGNGTASRETEELVAEVLAKAKLEVAYTLVDEAGASVYSASEVAGEEFPDLDATVRGTISIGRRLQDPLAELVKIDPRSIGVGLYQHDIEGRELTRALDAVVEDCVNKVGVDLNTASVPLLARIAGLTKSTARAVVLHREKDGPFRTRQDLHRVAGIGPRTFEQAAGFLRIRGGAEPLDATAVHPESYEATRRLLARVGVTLTPRGAALPPKLPLTDIAKDLSIGLPTLTDIVEELKKPGRDPRAELPPVVFRRDVLRMEDLVVDQWLEGTVRNVVPFGAFVDIGVKTAGLVHVSQLADRFVDDPHQVVKVGDRVSVRVLEVDADRGRIALSMRRGGGSGESAKSGRRRAIADAPRPTAEPPQRGRLLKDLLGGLGG